MTDPDQVLRKRLRPLGIGPGREDWTDVRRRARAHGFRRVRRRWVAVAVALTLAALAVGPALGLGGSVLDLFRDPEKPALPRSSLHPLTRLQFDRKYGDWSLHRVAGDGKTVFYALRDGGGEVVCVGSGREGRTRQIGMKCGDESALLGPERPVYYDVVVEATRENSAPHPWRVTGVAVDDIDKVAMVAGQQRLETPVEDNAFTITQFPPGDPSRLEIAALDGDGKVIFSEPLQGFGPTSAMPSPMPSPPRPLPPAPPPPRKTPLAGERPLQRGRSEDASVEVYRSGAVVFRMVPGSRAARLAGPYFGCVKFTTIDGRRYPVWEGGGAGNLAPTGVKLQATTRGGGPSLVDAPFDGCEVQGSFGRRWNDPRGVRSPVEIPLTSTGRHYFDRRAAARDLALFVRSPRIAKLRRLLRQNHTASLPRAADITSGLPNRVIALPEAGGRPDGEQIGLWTDGRRLIAARSVGGNRLFIEIENGRIARDNLDRLTRLS
jgi:hypothetical protein